VSLRAIHRRLPALRRSSSSRQILARPSAAAQRGQAFAGERPSGLAGGIETTEGMIVNLVWHLLTYGGEPSANALEESLRLEPAAAVIDRYATRDVELAGASIRKGDFVEISIAGANRDPATFLEPDRFDPHRENAKLQVAFAHGPHVCVGMHLARLEALTAAERLFARLPGLRLDPDRLTSPRGLVFRKPPRLDVLW